MNDEQDYEHECDSKSLEWPRGFWECYVSSTGYLWLNVNGEYGIEVKFCPFCGYESKKEVE